MNGTRKVALRVNGVQAPQATLRRGERQLELVIAAPRIGGFVIDESFTLELLELFVPPEIRSRLPNAGWRRVSLPIFIALLRGGVIRVVGYS